MTYRSSVDKNLIIQRYNGEKTRNNQQLDDIKKHIRKILQIVDIKFLINQTNYNTIDGGVTLR